MPRGEGRPLTPTDVAHHLACAHRTQLERRVREGTRSVAFAPDARLQAMRIRGAEHERAYVERQRASGKRIVDLSQTRDPAATIAAMRTGADLLVQAPLGNDTFFGIADVLQRTDTPSALGDYSYQPVDTKLAAETKAGALLQLLTYCELLGSMQGTIPAQFRVVTPLADEPYRTADYAAYFRVIRDHVRAAHTITPPPSTYPDPVPHCDICCYWQICDQQRRADDHPSLIADIQRAHVHELQRQGLPTLAAFATEGKLPNSPERGRPETYDRLAHQARLQLQARTGRIPVEPLPIEPNRGLCRLPTPSPGDVFLDFEGDPFVGQGGLEYLTGYSYTAPEGMPVYGRIWALDHAAERQALEALLDFLAARLQTHPDLHIYHFGAYEVSALRRLCARHDTRGSVLDGFLRGKRFVNLHTLVREALRIGIESYGLKDLEKVIGYQRQFDLRAAGEARRDLELHLELGRRNQITRELREQVAAYNRDDCLATAHLRDWLEQQRAQVVAAGQTMPRPALGAPEASPDVRANEARIEALRAALTRDLPAPDARNDEQRAKALLGDLVGYFLRERKSAWWEHFRLRELPADERLAEREMLAELRFVGTEPKVGGETTLRCAYTFPPQETAIDVGDAVHVVRDDDPATEGVGTRLGTIAEIDPSTGHVVIKQGKKTDSLRPSAIFREQVVKNDVLETGLLEFAEHVRDHGFAATGPFAPAADLILRRAPPRVTKGKDGRLRLDGESTVKAALRVCQQLGGGVLPIQGPPGAGKSFTGGHTIAGLVQAGHRVGVTAVSHKVIDNLLGKVREAAVESGTRVRLVHKHDQDPPTGIEYLANNVDALGAIARGTVVGGTAWLWARADAAETLDYLFVDEAGQMSLAQVLAFARAAKNLVLLGDPQQLEQPHQGTHPDGADVAALTHLIGTDRATLRDEQGLFLPKTWRLHPTICAFTSELYYEGRLSPIDGCEQQRIDGTGVVDGAGMFLLECAHEGNQASAPEEADTIVALARQILRPGATCTNRDGKTRALTPDDLLVIAPYNAQVGALRRALAPLRVTKVGTVDKFQGQEAPLVIYSCTSSSPQDAPRGMSFLYDPHRLNVATSRAQCAFVMVANPTLFEPEVRTPEQMRWANGMCRFREAAKALSIPDQAGQ
ncbi:MAG TPA: TM0106 family RecB-like putative nuclease [Planctomycetota bacterium]|nr:TM0106 family RecB-like putative nuclease [Planctomycetota bacterium]